MSDIATKIARGGGATLRGKAATLSALIPPGAAEWTQWTYMSYAAEGYGGNPYVYRAIQLVAQSIASLPVYAMASGTNEDGEEERAPVPAGHDMQRVLTKPNSWQGWEQFCQEWVCHMFLAGDSFIARPKDKVERLRFTALRPDLVDIKKAKDERGREMKQLASGYTYGHGADAEPYTAEQVAHVYFYNPLDDWRGMSPLCPAAKSVDTNNSSRKYHKALFDNGAVGGVVITSVEGATDAELEVLGRQIEAKKQGVIRAGMTWLLPSTQKMEKAAWSPRDAMTPDLSVMSLREIAIGLGIDPALLGDSTSKIYANVREARSALYIDVVIPLAKLLFGALTAMLQDWYPGIAYEIDKDAIEELSESQDGLWDRVIRGVQALVITPNEGRELLRYEKIEAAWADRFYTSGPGGLVPMGDDVEGEGEPATPAATTVAPAALPAGEAGAVPAEPLANTALNGAQVASAVAIVQAVASGQLPRSSGVAMLERFFMLSKETAEAVMGEVGDSFFADAPDAALPAEGMAELTAIETLLDDGDREAAEKALGRAARARTLRRAVRTGEPIVARILKKLAEGWRDEALRAAS